MTRRNLTQAKIGEIIELLRLLENTQIEEGGNVRICSLHSSIDFSIKSLILQSRKCCNDLRKEAIQGDLEREMYQKGQRVCISNSPACLCGFSIVQKL